MKKLFLLLGCSLATTGLLAFAPHPSVLTVKQNDQMLPVVKVIDTDPVVIVDGKEKRIRYEPTYLVQRADRYGEGFVEAMRVSLAGVQIKTVASPSDAIPSDATLGRNPGTAYFEGTFKARAPLNGGFIVVGIYSPASFADPSGESRGALIVHDLPDLPAGVEVPVKVSCAMFNNLPHQGYFIQLFDSSGREVLMNNMTAAWQYYALRDRAQLTGVVAKYCEKFQGADHAAVPAVMARPVFRDGLTPPKSDVSAVLTVSAEGTVTDVKVRGVDDASVRQSIAEALGGWLFLPQLKAGQPVASKIQVPLQF